MISIKTQFMGNSGLYIFVILTSYTYMFIAPSFQIYPKEMASAIVSVILK